MHLERQGPENTDLVQATRYYTKQGAPVANAATTTTTTTTTSPMRRGSGVVVVNNDEEYQRGGNRSQRPPPPPPPAARRGTTLHRSVRRGRSASRSESPSKHLQTQAALRLPVVHEDRSLELSDHNNSKDHAAATATATATAKPKAAATTVPKRSPSPMSQSATAHSPSPRSKKLSTTTARRTPSPTRTSTTPKPNLDTALTKSLARQRPYQNPVAKKAVFTLPKQQQQRQEQQQQQRQQIKESIRDANDPPELSISVAPDFGFLSFMEHLCIPSSSTTKLFPEPKPTIAAMCASMDPNSDESVAAMTEVDARIRTPPPPPRRRRLVSTQKGTKNLIRNPVRLQGENKKPIVTAAPRFSSSVPLDDSRLGAILESAKKGSGRVAEKTKAVVESRMDEEEPTTKGDRELVEPSRETAVGSKAQTNIPIPESLPLGKSSGRANNTGDLASEEDRCSKTTNATHGLRFDKVSSMMPSVPIVPSTSKLSSIVSPLAIVPRKPQLTNHVLQRNVDSTKATIAHSLGSERVSSSEGVEANTIVEPPQPAITEATTQASDEKTPITTTETKKNDENDNMVASESRETQNDDDDDDVDDDDDDDDDGDDDDDDDYDEHKQLFDDSNEARGWDDDESAFTDVVSANQSGEQSIAGTTAIDEAETARSFASKNNEGGGSTSRFTEQRGNFFRDSFLITAELLGFHKYVEDQRRWPNPHDAHWCRIFR